MATSKAASPEQAAFVQRLKDTLEAMMDSYVNILQAGKLGSKAYGRESAERERLLLTTHASSIVGDAQHMLKLITELKLSVLTSNLEGQNEIVEAQNAAFRDKLGSAAAQVKALEADVDETLRELEDHYYRSFHR